MKTLRDRPVIGTQPIRKPRRRATTSQPHRFNRILVPIDFSRSSLKAIPYALAVARQFGAHVQLLHIVDTTQYPPPTLLTLPLVPLAEWDKRLMKRLEAIALKYRTNGTVSALKPRSGTAHEEICATAREVNADLIVIATRGYTGIKHMFLGSTAERVVRHSSCPVLVVRLHAGHWNGSTTPLSRTGFQLTRILTPTDFSDCSQLPFDYAAQLARDFKAELRLVHVINPHAYPFGDQHLALDAAQLTREATEAAQKQMRAMAAKSNLRYSTRVMRGSPAIEICRAANDSVDLIVISTHGRTGLGHVLIGSVAERVVRHAHCPVLVIPHVPNPTRVKHENTILKPIRSRPTSGAKARGLCKSERRARSRAAARRCAGRSRSGESLKSAT
jgi:nucleotide-binding universal stress UspA family protein